MIKRNIIDWVFDIVNYVILGVLLIMTLYPFWYIFIYSISDPSEASKGNIFLIPAKITLVNYIMLFSSQNIVHAAFISIARTVVGTVITVFACAMFAYVLTKKLFPFRKAIYKIMIFSMYVTPGFIPVYILIRNLQLKNNFLVYIIPNIFVAFTVILIKTYIESLPVVLEESALIDGAGYMTIFIRIILPLCTPVLAAMAVFTTVGQWSSWMDNMFYCPITKLETLQYLLYKFMSSQQASLDTIKQRLKSHTMSASMVTPASLRMAITMIVTLPIIIIYPSLQRYFMKGLLVGAIKG